MLDELRLRLGIRGLEIHERALEAHLRIRLLEAQLFDVLETSAPGPRLALLDGSNYEAHRSHYRSTLTEMS